MFLCYKVFCPNNLTMIIGTATLNFEKINYMKLCNILYVRRT